MNLTSSKIYNVFAVCSPEGGGERRSKHVERNFNHWRTPSGRVLLSKERLVFDLEDVFDCFYDRFKLNVCLFFALSLSSRPSTMFCFA